MRKVSTFFILAAVALTAVSAMRFRSDSLKRSNDRNLVVKTSKGAVEGFMSKLCRAQKPYAVFRGIPYAEPPVGNLRFKDPVERSTWSGIWNATYQRSGCSQKPLEENEDSIFSEDCLYLNVYTPNLNYLSNRKNSLMPVMVFIHMGAFIMGSSYESLVAPDFLVERDIVLVTFNYRLGAFGFLSLQNAEVSGNAGLKDQNLALKWVKRNIQAFGGDPNKITIFGESAGAASVNYHLLSKASAGLFRGAIMQSGSAIAPWAYSPPDMSLKKSYRLGKKVGCGQKDPKAFLNCMQSVPAERIVLNQQKALTTEELLSMRVIAFHPTIEPKVPGAFITEPPYDIMRSGKFNKVPVIIGENSNEGLLVYPVLEAKDPKGRLLTLVGMDLSRFFPYHFNVKPFTKTAIHVHQEISKFYFKDKVLTKKNLGEVLELLSDVMFILPIQLTASLISNSSVPVYNYEFTYDGAFPLFKANKHIMVPGVSHGDDLGYLFYNAKLHTQCGQNETLGSPQDELTIDRMTKMWTDFAKTLNPTPKRNDVVPVTWKPFTWKTRNFLNIGVSLVPSDSIKLENMMFWEELIHYVTHSKSRKENESEASELVEALRSL